MIKNKLKRVLAVALAGMMVAGVAGCSSSKRRRTTQLRVNREQKQRQKVRQIQQQIT